MLVRPVSLAAIIACLTVAMVSNLPSHAAGVSDDALGVYASIGKKLHPAPVRMAALAEEPVKAWVFLSDKGYASAEDQAQAVEQLAQRYNSRALRRRAMRSSLVHQTGALCHAGDLPVAETYVAAIEATGARVHMQSRWLNAVSVWADGEQLSKIAALPFVRTLRPVARGKRIDRNLDSQSASAPGVNGGRPDLARAGSLDYGLSTDQLAQINLIALHETGATGMGVVIGFLDTGFRRGHNAFHHPEKPLTVVAEYDFVDDDGNADVEPGDPSAQHFHGTLILGVAAAYAPGELVGGAFDASYILCKTEDTTAEYQAEEDNYVAGLEFIEANGGDVVNSSLGYIDWYTQDDLDGQTAVTTIAVNIATSLGVHCCTSAGNNGNDDDPTTSRLIAPADAFEVVTVGAVGSNGGTSALSSDGPSADGRIKPEVMARGVDTFTIEGYGDALYNAATGTSMSCPLVASAVACLVQIHPEWTPEQMRTVLLRTADDFVANGVTDPLFVRGYGVVNAYAAALDCNFNGILDGCDIDCEAMAGTCDVPGCGQSEDCDADGIPDDCEVDCNGNGVADACDITDCAPDDSLCADCNRNEVPDGCEDPFPQQGRVSLDQPSYICESTVTITVDDCGPDADDGVAESVEVVIQSNLEPEGESVLLTETGAATGRFVGSIVISKLDSPGVLHVEDGNTLTATYVDGDDGLGGLDVPVDALADVDCSPPIVSDVNALVLNPFAATITFNTDEPAIATVRYGTSCGALHEQVVETEYMTSFELGLDDLSETTTYYFAIDVEDVLANGATYDDGGACHRFETPEIPNYFTEYFLLTGNDLDHHTFGFYPDESVDIYSPCGYEIFELPTDPAGGTVLNLDVDDFVEIAIGQGKTFSLYGVPYASFFVGTNGYVTFGEGDDDWTESLADHFSLPRISGHFDDLDPRDAGTISWKQLQDRIAVTYEDVPEYFTGNSNTFQIEMFFDGRIQISYLGIDAEDGLTGLSAGTGLVPDFVESDFTSFDDCGPRPPTALDSHVVTNINTAAAIQLDVVDDGLPVPPGALTYIVLSLPEHGSLRDPAGGQIESAPYTLVGNDGVVEYTPQPWFGGADAFNFMANDGGDPPEGGDSNEATVTIAVGAMEHAFDFDMNADPGWTTEGLWAHGVPTGGGSHDGDPTSGFTGANVYGYNLFGDYEDDLPPTHLTTTALDCSQWVDTQLTFQRWLGVEHANWDNATLSLSLDGQTWTTLWDHTGADISDTSWIEQVFDIAYLADGQETVYLRWTMGPTDGFVTFPGWNLDDVVIQGVRLQFPGDFDDNGAVDLADHVVFANCLAGPDGGLGIGCSRTDLDLDGDVDLHDASTFQMSFQIPGR